jgi:hypothetical protein
MGDDFGPAIQRALGLYREVYGPTLVAVYVAGSAHRGEAVIGVSDLDMYAFANTTPPPTARDVLWARSLPRLTRGCAPAPDSRPRRRRTCSSG